MGFDARVLTVLVASPGDTAEARDVVEGAITSWNRDRARRARVVLVSLRWETDAVPQMGEDGQSVINRQLVDDADIVVALFHSRLGAPTPRAVSGTAEEIDRAVGRNAPVHVYFAEMPYPYGVDPAELTRLQEFREDIQQRALVGKYISHDDLTAKVRTALEEDVGVLALAATAGLPSAGQAVTRAVLRARYARGTRGSDRLVIENVGDAPAQNVEVSVEAIGQGHAPELVGFEPIENLPPRTGYPIVIAVTMGIAAQWRITLRWHEKGEVFEEAHSVSAF